MKKFFHCASLALLLLLLASCISEKSEETTTSISAFEANPENGSILLSWRGTNNIQNYKIFLDGFQIDQTVNTNYSVNTNLINGKQYRVKVSGVLANDMEVNSTELSVTLSALSAPKNFKLTPGFNEITLNWETVSQASSYTIYTVTGSTVMLTSTLATTVDNSYVVSDLTNGVEYRYKVQPLNSLGRGELSEELSATPPFDQVVLKLNTDSSSQITLTWNTVSSVSYYELYRSTSKTTALAQKISAPLPFEHTYIDTGLESQTLYFYWIIACDNTVCTSFDTPVHAQTFTVLNDSGILYSGGTTSNATACDNAAILQDCHQGIDADNNVVNFKQGGGNGGFDFSKLDSQGVALSIQDKTWSGTGSESSGTSWSCVQDNNTGLIWETKTLTGLHSSTSAYSWYDPDGSVNGNEVGEINSSANVCFGYDSHQTSSYCNTRYYIGRVNSAKLCGFDDWRLPNLEELSNIVNYGHFNPPAIEKSFFPNTPVNTNYWVFTPYARDPIYAWALNLSSGNDEPFHLFESNFYVKLVRGGSVPPLDYWGNDRYTNNGDGTVTDQKTSLMWAKCVFGMTDLVNCTGTSTEKNWSDALQEAENSTLAGHNNWRLPNIKELRTLVDYSQKDPFPSINNHFFPNTPKEDFWTSSPNSQSGSQSWMVFFGTGADGNRERNTLQQLRLVRNL